MKFNEFLYKNFVISILNVPEGLTKLIFAIKVSPFVYVEFVLYVLQVASVQRIP